MVATPVNSGTASGVQYGAHDEESKSENGIVVESENSDEIQPILAASAPTGKRKYFYSTNPVLALSHSLLTFDSF